MTYIKSNDKTFNKVGVKMIYLDYAATTPISDDALFVYNEASKKYFANASSLHELGTKANEALEASRMSWAQMINGEKEGIYFTSGGTESNQLALLSIIEGNKHRGNHLITTKTEHSSVYHLFKKLETEGFRVTYIDVNEDGIINVNDIERAITSDTILVSIQYVNGEIGTINPIAEIGALLETKKVMFHTDCVQAFGNVLIDVKRFTIDSLSVSSHKLYGPKGIGMCFINPRIEWKSQIPHTSHEYGFRPGTVDVPAILSFTFAGQQAEKHRNENKEKYSTLRQELLFRLQRDVKDYEVYESKINQLPQIVGLSVGGLQGQYIMLKCNENSICVSTGSACQVGQQEPSRMLLSMGKSRDEANQLVRVTLGKTTTIADIEQLVQVLQQIS